MYAKKSGTCKEWKQVGISPSPHLTHTHTGIWGGVGEGNKCHIPKKFQIHLGKNSHTYVLTWKSPRDNKQYLQILQFPELFHLPPSPPQPLEVKNSFPPTYLPCYMHLETTSLLYNHKYSHQPFRQKTKSTQALTRTLSFHHRCSAPSSLHFCYIL